MEERHTNEYTSLVSRNAEYSRNKFWLIFPDFPLVCFYKFRIFIVAAGPNSAGNVKAHVM